MLNVRTLDIFLRMLDSREAPGTARPAAPVAAIAPTRQVGAEAAPIPREAAQAIVSSTAARGVRIPDPLTLGARAELARARLAAGGDAPVSEGSIDIDSRGGTQARVAPLVARDVRAAGIDEARASPLHATAVGATGAIDSLSVRRAGADASSTELSAAAVWLQKALVQPLSQSQPNIRAAHALLPQPVTDVPALAQALRSSMVESGLFYESHLAEWSTQAYDLASLRHEPQAGWSAESMIAPQRLEAEAANAVARSETAGNLAPGMVAAPDSEVAGLVARAPSAADSSVDMIRSQLAALESRQVRWAGELWPGQSADIAIGREPTEADDAEASSWRTTIVLRLPQLGRLEARLNVSGRKVELEIVADDPASVDRLRSSQKDLVDSLEARQARVTALSIHVP